MRRLRIASSIKDAIASWLASNEDRASLCLFHLSLYDAIVDADALCIATVECSVPDCGIESVS